ncbi:MAG: flavin reductase family protein [Fidelibacterota bacterium]
MTSKQYLEIENPHRLITPGSVAVISVGNGRKDNLFSVAWNMPLRKEPPMVAILAGKGHYSYSFINETGEFGFNIPDISIAKQVIKAGKVSGSEIDDKFDYVGLERQKAGKIKAPLLAEAIARLECRVSKVEDMGSSVLLIAQILRSEVREDCWKDNQWDFSNGLQMIHHMGGNKFAVSDKSIAVE